MSWLRPRRPIAVAGLLLAALALLVVSRPVWVTASALRPGASSRIELAGAEASAVVPAVAIVVGACAIALTLAGRRLRFVVLMIALVACVGVGAAAALVAVEPAAAVRGTLASSTGVTADSLQLQSVSATSWPWVCVAVAALAALWAGLCLRASPGWDSAARHEQPVSSGSADPDDPATTWDALSRGDDPTH